MVSRESDLPTEARRGKRLALVVGVDHVPNSLWPPLRSARKDAEAVAQALTECCQFELLVPPLLDDCATSAAVKRALLRLAKERTSDDFLLFYFSGHGIPMEIEARRNAVYLGTSDFAEEEVKGDENFHLPLHWLRDKLYIQTEAGKVVLILDACYSGEMGRCSPDPYLEDLQKRIAYYFNAPGGESGAPSGGLRLALTATGHNLPAQEGPDHGLMTSLLFPALRGHVPETLGRQGQLELKRLSAYLDEQYAQKGLCLPSLSGDSAGQLCILASFPSHQMRQISSLPTQGYPDRPNSYLPFSRHPYFQPRPGEFKVLEDLLFASGSSPVRLGLVGMTGMGGVGKTQLAIEVAYRYQDRFPDGIFWMPATGRDMFAWQQTLAQLALKTDYLPPEDDPAHSDAQMRRARHLCRYFATHADALLILDNIEVPDLVLTALTELAGGELACHLLYTSRQQRSPMGAMTYVVTPLSVEDGLRLLLESTRLELFAEIVAGGTSQEAEAACDLCQEVGGLPLALTHLRGLLSEDRHMQLQDLLMVLQQRGVLSLKDTHSQLPSLEETFSLSWKLVGEERARQCFLLASLFPEAVPIPLWLLGVASGLGESALPFDPLWEVSLHLQHLNLLEGLSGEQVRLHPLVRAFGQHRLQQEQEKAHLLRTQVGQRLVAIFCDLTFLEQRARSIGYQACLGQIRAARDYAIALDTPHADQLTRLERIMDRESYLLADKHWWPETLPSLFYQQIFNRAKETGDAFPSQQSPSCWIRLMEAGGTADQALLRILSGHTDAVNSVAFSPDGRYILTGSDDCTARLWESCTGQLRASLQGHTDGVNSVAFSPDGRQILTGSWDQTARLWESSTGQHRATLQGHIGVVRSVAFSPDGRRVLTGSSDRTARLWESSTGQLRATLRGHTSTVESVAFSPDGRHILTGSEDSTARLWESSTGQHRASLQGHLGVVRSVAFSPDGHHILTGSYDKTARLWESSTGQHRAILQGHTGEVRSVAFSPNGRHILTGSYDKTARLWESSTGQHCATLQGHTGWINCVAFSPDGQHILTGSYDKTARLWESSSGQHCATLQGYSSIVESVAFSPDGQLILVTGLLDLTARLWESSSGQHCDTLQGYTDWVRSVAFSSDGQHILTGSCDCVARLWESSTGQHRATLQGHTSIVESVTFSPDGRHILTGSGDKTARLWERSTGQLRATLWGHTSTVESVKFSPDGRHILTGSGDKTARLWESSSGHHCVILQGHTGGIKSVAFSPDGRHILTGSWDCTARLWESCTGQLCAILQGHTGFVEIAAFSPDGQLALISDSSGWTYFWDIQERDDPHLLGLYVTCDRVASHFWQDSTHLLLADHGGGSGRPFVYSLCLEGSGWQRR